MLQGYLQNSPENKTEEKKVVKMGSRVKKVLYAEV